MSGAGDASNGEIRMPVIRHWALAAAAALSLCTSAALAAEPALPNPAQFGARIAADVDRGDAADLAAAQRQLEALVLGVHGPHASPGRLKAVADLFDVAYGKLTARCPAKRPPETVLQGFARIAASLRRPAPRQAQACAAGPGGSGGYTASGGGGGLKVSGAVGDITHTFTLNGVFPGGRAVFTYTPDGPGALTGKDSYTLAGSGVTGSGKGTYRMSRGAGGVVTINSTNSGCVHGIGGSCRTTKETITLTPRGR
jgi:hypothetical protein